VAAFMRGRHSLNLAASEKRVAKHFTNKLESQLTAGIVWRRSVKSGLVNGFYAFQSMVAAVGSASDHLPFNI
jgi:hypothetical protein